MDTQKYAGTLGGGSVALPPNTKATPLKEANLRMIQNWVELADSLGIARSLAQIYGLIFVSPRPVSAQDCVDALKISRSSAGQGLKTLKEAGAIRSHFELGERQETFSIEPDLGKLMTNIMAGRIFPAFDNFFNHLEESRQIAQSENNSFIISRVEKLHRWEKKLKLMRVLLNQ